MIYIFLGVAIFVITIILLSVIFFLIYKNRYDFLFIKVKEADNNLDILLQKKEEILLKIIPILEDAKIKDLPLVIKLKSKRLDHHELYNELMEMTTETLKLIDDYESKLDIKKINKLIDLLWENENDLKAALKYYNDNGEEINYLAHKFPANIIKFFLHYQDVELYKIQKRQDFAILKN